MLFNDRVLFLHVPKAAGTSVTSFLIGSLQGPVTITEPPRLPPSGETPLGSRLKLAIGRMRHELSLLRRPWVRRIAGKRHEDLSEASSTLARSGLKLEDFEIVLAVIRNPYDLEVSRFHYLCRGHLGVPGLGGGRNPSTLALAGDFAAFAERAPYYGRLPARIEAWFEIDGRTPSNLSIVRYETLEQDLRRAVLPYCRKFSQLPHLNASEHAPYSQYLSPAIEEAIYRKYSWVFDRGFYRRELPPQ